MDSEEVSEASKISMKSFVNCVSCLVVLLYTAKLSLLKLPPGQDVAIAGLAKRVEFSTEDKTLEIVGANSPKNYYS